jgi:chromosome segregation ATPase
MIWKKKIEEFNILSDHYQSEKESYIHVLEHVQDQVNVYKQKSEQFDAEKGSWSKQIDELKSELIQTKATIVKMEELEQQNVKLAAEIQAKDMEIYKIKKESERALQQQMEQIKDELKLYQDKIVQFEKDREIWEKQMKQMKAQFAVLESNLEEKENFIKQYITQPLTPQASIVRPAQQINSQPQQPSSIQQNSIQQDAIQQNSTPQQQLSQQQSSQQPTDWFQRMVSQQQGLPKLVQKSQNSSSATTTMDFFTLRSKTTQPSASSEPTYGSQWDQD